MNLSKNAFKIVFTANIIILIIVYASTAYAELRLDSVYPTLGQLVQNLEVTMTGSNFDGSTRVSMSLDAGNRRAILSSLDLPGFEEDVTVQGNIAYVAAGGGDFQIIDISNPKSLKIIGSVDMPGSASAVTVQENLAYVADGKYGLQVIDISNPLSPRIIGSVDTPGRSPRQHRLSG